LLYVELRSLAHEQARRHAAGIYHDPGARAYLRSASGELRVGQTPRVRIASCDRSSSITPEVSWPSSAGERCAGPLDTGIVNSVASTPESSKSDALAG
jgi:hypothetical protein